MNEDEPDSHTQALDQGGKITIRYVCASTENSKQEHFKRDFVILFAKIL